ncbi:MAG TPA: hypothetical protein VIY69_04890, partial [Candidatus Acidoferrales bacterium]
MLAFSDPDSYATAFGSARIAFTITGAGDFAANMTRLKLSDLEVCRFYERLPRIAYISLSTERVLLSFPIGAASPVFGGSTLRNGDMIFHSGGERVHQRSNGECQWGSISLSPEQFVSSGTALTGRPITLP